jgi:hypothetical protein
MLARTTRLSTRLSMRLSTRFVRHLLKTDSISRNPSSPPLQAIPYAGNESEIAGIECHQQPVCALAFAVYHNRYETDPIVTTLREQWSTHTYITI